MRYRTGRDIDQTIYEQAGDEPSKSDRLLAFGASPETAAEVVSLLNEAAELRVLFEVQWGRMAEATARWRAEDPEARALVMPDLGHLLRWLMDRADIVQVDPGASGR